jgi:hypothetical protein
MTVRISDPATSHIAATNIARKLPTLKAAFVDALQALGQATANEIAKHATDSGVAANAESVRKRALELIRDGLAKYGPSRTCKVTGQLAGTLELTHADSQIHAVQRQHAETDGRTSTRNLPVERTQRRTSQAVQDIAQPGESHQSKTGLQGRHAELVEAVVGFVRDERGWCDEWRIGIDIGNLRRAGACWPDATTDEWINAVKAAVDAGKLERGENKRVRFVSLPVAIAEKQLNLFGEIN